MTLAKIAPKADMWRIFEVLPLVTSSIWLPESVIFTLHIAACRVSMCFQYYYTPPRTRRYKSADRA